MSISCPGCLAKQGVAWQQKSHDIVAQTIHIIYLRLRLVLSNVQKSSSPRFMMVSNTMRSQNSKVSGSCVTPSMPLSVAFKKM